MTGASSGIGAATARLLRDHGWELVIVARRADRLQELSEELGGATTLAVDLTQDDAATRLAAVVRDGFGRLDLLVNNAGARFPGRFDESGVVGLERHMAINMMAVAAVTHALLPLLRATPGSAIVTVASVSSFISRAGAIGYSSAKAAVRAFSDGLALEEAAHGVHVGLVVPGFVATEGFPQTELIANVKTRWALSTPEAVAAAVVLAGPGGRAQVHVPRAWALATALRAVAPGVLPWAARLMGAQLTPQARSVADRSTDPAPDVQLPS